MLGYQKKDTLFKTHGHETFAFNEKVAKVFSNMIDRSVPSYKLTLQMVKLFAQYYVQAQSNCYDLGTSLGACAYAMQNGIAVPGCTIIAVDNSKDMLERVQHRRRKKHAHIHFIQNDIQDISIENASMVVLNFTLQFLALNQRANMLKNIYEGLLPQGICIVSEKFDSADPVVQEHFDRLHALYKIDNGYSKNEVQNKQDSLRNILIPSTEEQFEEFCKEAGFNLRIKYMQNLQFHSYFLQKIPSGYNPIHHSEHSSITHDKTHNK